MSLRSFRSSNAILYVPTRNSNPNKNLESNTPRSRTLVFFITGNPGLISYYDEFLNTVALPYKAKASSGRDDDSAEEEVVVAGFSLGGFVTTATDLTTGTGVNTATATASATAASPSLSEGVSQHTPTSYLEDELRFTFPPSHQRKEIYSLRDQVELSYERLVYLVGGIHKYYYQKETPGDGGANDQFEHGNRRQEKGSGGGPPVKVILMGHSVGAYIALEIVRLHHQNQHSSSSVPDTPSDGPSLSHQPSFTIVSTHLLTPTILNISHSPSGRIATPLLSTIPFFPSLIQLFSSSLTYLVSPDRLEMIVSRVTGMKKGSRALKSTVEFLGGRGMVQQALSMARDEMREIGSDQWGEEVWGVSRGAADRVADGADIRMKEERTNEGKEMMWIAPRTYFLFAKKDHWVADLTREEIIKGFQAGYRDHDRDQDDNRTGSRDLGTGSKGPTVVVDETDGLVHAWCLEQSAIVAERVRGWIMETLKEGL